MSDPMQNWVDGLEDEVADFKSQLDTAMRLLRDNQSPMHFDRELTTADHDIIREARKWR